jgi:hypothetical protein
MRNAHLGEELTLYWPSKFVHPFCHLMTMGEKFRGFKGNGFILKFGLCLSVLPLMHFIFIMLCMVEYIEETLPRLSLTMYAMKFKFITRAYIVGEFALYMLVLLTSLALVVVV